MHPDKVSLASGIKVAHIITHPSPEIDIDTHWNTWAKYWKYIWHWDRPFEWLECSTVH